MRDTDTGRIFTTLQAAVDAARRGDRLTVRGKCRGPTVIDRGLVIEGVQDQGSAEAILHGHHRGVVVTVTKGVTVTIADVSITGGRGRFREGGSEKPHRWPAGVVNRGRLTLAGVVVRRNQGIGVKNAGSLRLTRGTVVGNNGYWAGNDVYSADLDNTGTVQLNGTSTIRGEGRIVNDGLLVLNGAASVTHCQVQNSGTLTLNDASKFGNTAEVENAGSMTLNDASRIIGYVRDGYNQGGRGVSNTGTLNLNDSSLIRDWFTGVVNSGTLTLNDDSRISHNGDFKSSSGPAVVNTGTLTLSGTSQINDNWLGVENWGSVTLNGSSAIRDNHRLEYRGLCNVCAPAPRLVGAGVSNRGSLTLNDSSSISRNSAADGGAGVYLWERTGASLTMTGSSSIIGNTTGKSGGGIYAGAGTTLNGVVCGSQTGANVVANSPDDCHLE